MKKSRKWHLMAVFTAMLIMCLAISGITAYAAENIRVIVNGAEVVFDQGPVILDGQVMVPVRPIAEAMGWEVSANTWAIYLLRNGAIEIVPGKVFYTYYNSTIGLMDGELEIRHYNTVGGFDTHHFKYGHYPRIHGEVCPGERLCSILDEESAHQLTVTPVLHNGRMLMALEDLARAMYATVEWDGYSQIAIFTSGTLPFFDGNDIPDEYRNWLLNFTYTNFQPQGAVSILREPVLSETELLRAYEREIVRIVNEIRISEGLQPLETYSILDEAAQARAEELKIMFSHTRPNGEPPHTAFTELPFDYNGENIAISMMGRNPESAAAVMVDIWMRSDHRENIMRENSRYIGVGAVMGEDNKVYCVQVFMR